MIQTVTKGEMAWSYVNAFTKKGATSIQEKYQVEQDKMLMLRDWESFLVCFSPAVSESKHYQALISANAVDKTVLTLKIEGHERSIGGYEEEKFKATATVQVPASLNFFQLHRVACRYANYELCAFN